MTANAARVWLVKASLAVVGAELLFFLLAPILGYPISFPQAIRLLEVMAPTFFGYLGSATNFLFSTGPLQAIRKDGAKLVAVLVRGPIVIFVLGSVIALAVFGYSNRPSANDGSGMDMDTLALIFSLVLLSLLAVTTTVLIGYLFASEGGRHAP